MGVRFSGVAPVYRTLRADTSAHLRGDLDAMLLLAGWTHTSTVSSGIIYGLESPQGLLARCRIQDTGGVDGTPLGTAENYVDVQFGSADGARLGAAHRLIYSATNADYAAGYQAIGGPCQLFVSQAGISNEIRFGGHRYNHVAGGIPAITDAGVGCAVAGAPVIDEMWWSNGITKNGAQCFRTSRYCVDAYSVCVNGVLHTVDTNAGVGAEESYADMPLQVLPLTTTNNIDFWFYTPPSVIKFDDNSPLVIDAALGYRWQVIGQLWDAFLKSRDTTLDELVTSTETDALGHPYTATWQAWNYGGIGAAGGVGTLFATLYLLRSLPPGVTPCNYAY